MLLTCHEFQKIIFTAMASEGRIITLVSIIVILFEGSTCQDRKLKLAPTGCETSRDNSSYNIVYIKGVGENDTVHHLWSSVGSFVVFHALTNNSNSLLFNCEKLFEENSTNAINFTEPPIYTFAVVLTQLHQYNDTDNSGEIPKTNNTGDIMTIPFYKMNWSNITISESEGEVAVKYHNVLSEEINQTNIIQIKLTASASQARGTHLPRLIHTADSAEIDFVLDKVMPIYENARFAVDLVIIGENHNEHFSMSSPKSMDDEYTPGVFKIIQLESASVVSGHMGGYLQWKPIVYTSDHHGNEDSTVTREYDPVSNYSADDVQKSISYSYYGPDLSSLSIQTMTISFGGTDDEFYQKTNYSSWTFMVGYGLPPQDTMSTFVIIIVSVGLGIPVLLLISGFAFRAVHSRVKKDDLHLSSEQ